MRLLEDGDVAAGFVSVRGGAQVKFFRDEALAGQRADMSRTYVMPGEGTGPAVLGFYTLCMGRVTSTDLAENKGKPGRLPPTPAALLAQLARNDEAPKGLGKELLLDALERVMSLADQIGCNGAFLHAQVPELIKFYEDAGFTRIGSASQANPTFWMSMRDIRRTFEVDSAASLPPGES